MSKINNNKKITTNKGFTFEQLQGQSILDASIEAAYPINHSCRSGRCGLCKAQVLCGETVSYRRETLYKKERKKHWILTCAHTAVSDTPSSLTLKVFAVYIRWPQLKLKSRR
jgi:CDP-4-dehydro-6-deoxyglucose reductase